MALNFNPEQFAKELEKNSSTVLFKKISSDIITPISALLKISQNFKSNHFLFESAENGNNKGRFSVLGFDPDMVWKSKESQSFLNEYFEKNPNNFIEESGNKVLENFRKFVKKCSINWNNLNYNCASLPAIASGIYGYMGYDLVRQMENLPDQNLSDNLQIPDSIFIRPQIIIVFDSLFDCALICAPVFNRNKNYDQALAKISEAEELLKNEIDFTENEISENEIDFDFQSNFTKEEYCKMVEKSKEYIVNGDIFQVLPSQRFTAKFNKKIPTTLFYRSLRSVNPSPFLFYLKLDDFVLSGSSPEIMVSSKNRIVTIRPLAGTRLRGKNLEEDKKIGKELLNDEKEVAEHLMLIDLGRHDVGRVSKEGSVKLTEKMIIEYYSHVMHISSNVEGILQDDLDALDALISGFPAGTVSGAPKIRAMEIIEEIEHERRSFYAGCVGYFSSNGDMETCITLRSALIKDEKIHLQSGAGVVFDSIPESEYQECHNKAQALIKACQKIKEFI